MKLYLNIGWLEGGCLWKSQAESLHSKQIQAIILDLDKNKPSSDKHIYYDKQ
jgi:hypothetical protein